MGCQRSGLTGDFGRGRRVVHPWGLAPHLRQHRAIMTADVIVPAVLHWSRRWTHHWHRAPCFAYQILWQIQTLETEDQPVTERRAAQ